MTSAESEESRESRESRESSDSLLDAIAETPGDQQLLRGTVIDEQYRIERVLGQGGMGVVYLARDLRLDRDVAIKVGAGRLAVAIGRIAREALALARLSHPNVVGIYQVGELTGRSYVVMEYVPGGTARTWCDGKAWREIIDLYLGAGEGLAAAHAAGILHRDVKPDNVLVGVDGRARVADFGLARTLADDKKEAPIKTEGLETGFAGTPAYMAPEQLARAAIDARADQFGLCASIWEALFGERPFPTRTTERDTAATAEPVRPANKKVPSHVETALRRGLRADPADRWPALEPLLAELRRDPARRTRALAIAGVVIAAGAGTFAVTSRGSEAVDPCAGGDAAIAGTWSAERASTLRTALAQQTAPPWLHDPAGRGVDAFDDWSRRWSTQYRAVCEGGRTAWSSSLSDRGVECLAETKRDLAATVEVMIATPKVVTKVDRLIAALPRPEKCSDPTYLAAVVAPPSDPARAVEVDKELAGLSRISALELVGDAKQAKTLIDAALPRAEKLDYPPLLARARGRHGHVAMVMGDSKTAVLDLTEAYFLARTSHDASTATFTAANLALTLLNQSRDGEARIWARIGDAEAQSADPKMQIAAGAALTAALKEANLPDQAVASADKTLGLARKYGEQIPDMLINHSGVYDMVGKFDVALADLDEGLAIIRKRFGDDHPKISDLERNRTLVLVHLHRATDAVAAARHALAVAEATGGHTASARAMLAVGLKEAKQFDEALEIANQTLVDDRHHEDPAGYNVASSLNNRAELFNVMGRHADAIAGWKESLALFADVLGPEGHEVGVVAQNLAVEYYRGHQLVDAAAMADKAVAVMQKTPDSPLYGQALIASGMIAADRKDFAKAKETVTKGLAKLDDDPAWRARGRLALAKVAVAAGDREGARSLATQARADATKGDMATTEIDQLLATVK